MTNDSESVLTIPLTRRRFVAAASGVAAGIGCGRLLAAETPDQPEFSFALVSDNHLGRRGESESKNMQAAVAEINKTPVSLTIFCGDLVNTGANEEQLARYPQWRSMAEQLAKPFYAVPGNHDPLDRFTKYIHPKTDYTLDHDRFRFIFFRDVAYGEHQGEVTAEQLKWIDAKTSEAAQAKQKVILVSHVILHRNLHPDVGWWIKKGEQEFRGLLKAHRETICAFFAGHFHCGLRGWNDTFGVQEVVLPSTSWNRNRGLEKAPGYALDEHRNGYVLAKIYRDRIVLGYKPIGEQGKAAKELSIGKA